MAVSPLTTPHPTDTRQSPYDPPPPFTRSRTRTRTMSRQIAVQEELPRKTPATTTSEIEVSPELAEHIKILESDHTNPQHLEVFSRVVRLAISQGDILPSGMTGSDQTNLPLPTGHAESYTTGNDAGNSGSGARRKRTSISSAASGEDRSSESSIRHRLPGLRSLARLRARRAARAALAGGAPSYRRHHAARASSVTYLLLRFPLFILILCIILIELILYFAVRQIVNIWEYTFTWRGKKKQLRHRLHVAPNYDAWREAAKQFDTYLGLDAWKRDPADPVYDWRLIRKQARLLRELREQGEPGVYRLLDALTNGGVKSNLGGCENARLYSRTYYGTKDVIEDYVGQVIESLEHVYRSNALTIEEKLNFFKQASRNYGRTALCLSGGASFAYYHFGVLRALLDQNLLPKVLTGTSGGAMVAAIVGTRTDEELRPMLSPSLAPRINAFTADWITMAKRFAKHRVLLDVDELARKLQWVTLGSLTFREAYERTGRILNITVVPYAGQGPPKLLNHLTAPNVIIWTALLASSAVPGLIPPVVLLMKNEKGEAEPFMHSGLTWRDGSLRVDIPIEALNYYFNVRYTIVSQVNPHITLFFYEHRGSVGRPSSHLRGKGWRGGFIASSIEHFLKLDLKKWVRLMSDLELLPRIMDEDLAFLWLQRFHGNVTIIPRVSLIDYPRLLSNPTPETLAGYIDGGQRRTWPKLHMIENRVRIERKITSCRRRLRRALLQANGNEEHAQRILYGMGSGSDLDPALNESDPLARSGRIPSEGMQRSRLGHRRRPTSYAHSPLAHSSLSSEYRPATQPAADQNDTFDTANVYTFAQQPERPRGGYESENEEDDDDNASLSSETDTEDDMTSNTEDDDDDDVILADNQSNHESTEDENTITMEPCLMIHQTSDES